MRQDKEKLLRDLAGTQPHSHNPFPGFTPITLRKGYEAVLGSFQPQSPDEDSLVESSKPLFGAFTPQDHKAFREALKAVYLEEVFSPEDLKGYFTDLD